MSRLTLLLFLLLLSLQRCVTTNNAGGNDETSTGISLSGLVYDKSNAKGVANVVTRLKATGFTTRTDNEGYFDLTISNDSIRQLGLNLDSISDTLQYMLDDTVVAERAIENWVDELPTLYIVQRNIYGKLSRDSSVVGFITVTLSRLDSTGTFPPCVYPLWHNRATNGYSGFAYFYNNDTRNVEFSIVVNSYSPDSLLTGQSRTITFPGDIAGDIEVPEFDPLNALPVPFAGNDTAVSINETVILSGTASDDFGGTITGWEWDAGNTGTFVDVTPDSIFSFTASSSPDSEVLCILQITDNDGNKMRDTLLLTVFNDAPAVRGFLRTEISIGDSLALSYSAWDTHGIREYYLDFGDGSADRFDTTTDTVVVHVFPSTAMRCTVSVTAVDSFGQTGVYRNVVDVLSDPPLAYAGNDTTVGRGDTIYLRGSGSTDRFGRIVRYE